MIKRQTLINIHLYLAAFFAPALLVMGFSGGMYLLGYKGEFKERRVLELSAEQIEFQQEDKVATVKAILQKAQVEHSFETVVGGGNNLLTRPSSKQHFLFQLEDGTITIIERRPDLMRALVELHKGHGPSIFKVYQEFMAGALIVILLSGLLLGILSPVLRRKTTIIASTGALGFIAFAMVF